ncbi:hypothetical protein Dimus_020621 [Dionaea muscipula]
MLQWMGGSRRNVTASGKSTQKRQKQYFEQRKWRRKHEIISIVENNVDGLTNTTEHQRNNRSLDILSLLNVPRVTEGCRATCSTEVNDSPADSVLYKKSTPTFHTERITPVNAAATTGMSTFLQYFVILYLFISVAGLS